MREAIERRIQEFLAQGDSRLDWVKPTVREHRFLPLYVGWVSAIGLRSDGSFVLWEHDSQPQSVKPLKDSYWERMGLCEGAKKYPELAALIPSRPAQAIECHSCQGTGRLVPPLICVCGGLGWILPGEARSPGPG